MSIAEIGAFAWKIIQVLTMLPIAIYAQSEILLSKYIGFAFISSDHVWWHNLILILVWLGLYAGLCILVWKLISGQCAMQMAAVEDKYDVPLYPAWVVILYLAGIIFFVLMKLDWLPLKPWAIWFTLCFPMIPWIYYLVRTGFGIISIILRQIYVAFLVALFLSFMFMPIVMACILLLFGMNLFDYFAETEPIIYTKRTTTQYEDGHEETKDEHMMM